jgi:hypothetical protein
MRYPLVFSLLYVQLSRGARLGQGADTLQAAHVGYEGEKKGEGSIQAGHLVREYGKQDDAVVLATEGQKHGVANAVIPVQLVSHMTKVYHVVANIRGYAGNAQSANEYFGGGYSALSTIMDNVHLEPTKFVYTDKGEEKEFFCHHGLAGEFERAGGFKKLQVDLRGLGIHQDMCVSL